MEAERLYTRQPSRTIQQKRGGEGALEMVDNRPAGILQAMSERPIQRVEDDEDTLQGKFVQTIQRMEDDEDAIQGEFEQPIQRKAQLTHIESEDFRKDCYAKSDMVTHGKHMLQGERFSKSKQMSFTADSREVAYQETKQQAINRIQRELEKEQKKKKPDSKIVAQLKKNETGMPDNLKAGLEDLSGFSMDDVRVHYGSSKPAAVQAHAYTQGTDIHIAPGQERHLPHEAWHVAQQMAGRVQPTTEIGGMPVNDNAALEHEADVMGAKANSFKI